MCISWMLAHQKKQAELYMDKQVFVNREKELRQIGEAIEILQDEQRLLRTPIIEFSGVQGIGKTTLLQQIKLICDKKSLLCIMNNADRITIMVP